MMQDSVSHPPSSDFARQLSAARDQGFSDGRQQGYLKGLRDGWRDARAEHRQEAHHEGHYQGHQEGLREGYQLALKDMMQDTQRIRTLPPFVAPLPTTITALPTPPPAPTDPDDDDCDMARSDRSSSVDDVIPGSIFYTVKPFVSHPTTATATSTTPPVFPAAPQPQPRRAAPAPRRAPAVPPAAPRNRVRANVSARHDPAWKAAMQATGTKIGVAMGLYLDGEITVNGQYAVTMARDPPCGRCTAAGRECRVLDRARERNLVSAICSHCIRQRRKCV